MHTVMQQTQLLTECIKIWTFFCQMAVLITTRYNAHRCVNYSLWLLIVTQVNACETAAKGGAKRNVSQADSSASAGSQVRLVR